MTGKSRAEASPAILLAALTAAAVAWEGRALRLAGLASGVALTFGVLWSNALAYREVAPRGQLLELSHIAGLAPGLAPTLMADFSPFGTRHILRVADVQAHRAPGAQRARSGTEHSLSPNAHAVLDRFDPSVVWAFRSLVLRRSPLASRPPSGYRLRWAGRYYELWQRPSNPRRAIEHLPLAPSRPPAGFRGVPRSGAWPGRPDRGASGHRPAGDADRDLTRHCTAGGELVSRSVGA